MVETQSDEILHNADVEDVSLLVVGDPFGYVCTPQMSSPDYLKLIRPRRPNSYPYPNAAQRRTPTSSSELARSVSPPE